LDFPLAVIDNRRQRKYTSGFYNGQFFRGKIRNFFFGEFLVALTLIKAPTSSPYFLLGMPATSTASIVPSRRGSSRSHGDKYFCRRE